MNLIVRSRYLRHIEVNLADRPRAVSATLTAHRGRWLQKPTLRRIYERYCKDIARRCVPGRTLEVGGGSGNLKEFLPDIITVDIQYAPWLNSVADAHRLPFANASFDNIVAFDVLHHLERPRLFLAETARVLKPGGRLIVMEPGITPLSHVFYKLFHPEPVRMGEDPLEDGPLSPDRDPYESNQAIPTLLFRRDPQRFEAAFPDLRLRESSLFGLFAYPLSGGFRPWCLIPESLVDRLLRLEDKLLPLIGSLMAFRLLAVVERRHDGQL